VEAELGDDPAEVAAALPEDIGDPAAGAAYRRHAAGVLLRRVLARREAELQAEGEPR
jgi:carbon-monoxide dehydrogenase medium subunit